MDSKTVENSTIDNKKICEQCSQKFEVTKDRKKFCSKECYFKSKYLAPDVRRERRLKRQKEYRLENLESQKIKDHEYYLKNKERILRKTAEYEKTHRAQKNMAQNRRNAKPERRALNQKRSLDYYNANKEKINEERRKNKTFLSAQSKKWRTSWRLKLFEVLGGQKCVRCGYDEDIDCLQFDHINDDRKLDIKYQMGMHNFCRYYALNPEIAKKKLQVLCVTCNWLKRISPDQGLDIKRFKLRQKLFNILGGAVCKTCGENTLELLQFDHINGGGKQERILFKNRNLEYYAKYPDEAIKILQVLCAMCNWKKEIKKKKSDYVTSF